MQTCKMSQEAPLYPQGEVKVQDKEKLDEVQQGEFIILYFDWWTLPQGQTWLSVADEASSQTEKKDTAHLFLFWHVTAV